MDSLMPNSIQFCKEDECDVRSQSSIAEINGKIFSSSWPEIPGSGILP
jgi:hypothetical protein